MGGSAFQSGTLGGTPSLPSALDFLAVHHVTSGRPRPCISPPHMRCTADQTPVAMRRLAGMCRGLTVPRRYKIGDMPPSGVGADSGNRTHVFGLESRRSAVELHPRVPPKGLCERRVYAAGLSRLSGRNIVIKMERFALIGFFALPRSCAVWGVSGRRAAHRHKEEVEKRKTICIRPRRLVHRCGRYPRPTSAGRVIGGFRRAGTAESEVLVVVISLPSRYSVANLSG